MTARKLTGLRRPTAASPWEKEKYYYDHAEDALWREVFPLFFKYIEGKKYGEPFELLDFWLDIFLRFFCWKDKKTRRRRYREAFIFIPRKNGKTMTLAAVTLALTMIMNKKRGQGYIIASDEEQGGIMFGMQSAMIRESEDLQEHFYAGCDYIEHVRSGMRIKVLSGSKTGKTGLKPDFVVEDEYQEQIDRRQEMVMETGAIANEEPVLFKIGTMGVEDETENRPWKEDLEKARRVIRDPREDEGLLPIVFECTQEDDPGDPVLWSATNPGFGVTIDEISFRRLWEKAKDDPEKRQAFCQYNLNMPVSVSSEYIDIGKYKALHEPFTFDLFAGKQCFAGLDIGVTDDMTAMTLLYPEWREIEIKDETGKTVKIMHPLVRLLPFYFCPTEAIKASEKRPFNYAPYVNSGLITECGTHAINWTDLRSKTERILKEVRTQELGYDPYRAGEMVEALIKKRIVCVKIPQTFKVLDFPTRRFRDDINEGDILHNGNEVFLWNLKNSRVISNVHLNIMLSKKHGAGKIDGVAAGINAYRVFMDAPPPRPKQEIFSF